jgi:hypothetical protein
MPGDLSGPHDLPHIPFGRNEDSSPLHNLTGGVGRHDDPDILQEPPGADEPPAQQHLGSAVLAGTESPSPADHTGTGSEPPIRRPPHDGAAPAPGEEPSEGRDGSDTAPTVERRIHVGDLSEKLTDDWNKTLRHLGSFASKVETVSTGRPHHDAASGATYKIMCHQTTTDGSNQAPDYKVTLSMDGKQFSSDAAMTDDDKLNIMMRAHDIKHQLPADHGSWVEEATQRLLDRDHPRARQIAQLIDESPYTEERRTDYTLANHACAGGTLSAHWDVTTITSKGLYVDPYKIAGDHWVRLDRADGTQVESRLSGANTPSYNIKWDIRTSVPSGNEATALPQPPGRIAATDASLARMTELVREAIDYREPEPPNPATTPPDTATKYTLDRLLRSTDNYRTLVQETIRTGITLRNDYGDCIELRCVSKRGADPDIPPTATLDLLVTSSELEVADFEAFAGERKTSEERAVIAQAMATLGRSADPAAKAWLATVHALLDPHLPQPPDATPKSALDSSPFATTTERKYYLHARINDSALATRTCTEISQDPPPVRETYDGSGVWIPVREPEVTYESLRVETPGQRVMLYTNIAGKRHIQALTPQDRVRGSRFTTEAEETAIFQRRIDNGTCPATQANMSRLLRALQNT